MIRMLIAMGLQGSVMIILVALLRVALLSRLPKGVFRALWIVVLVRLVVPLPMPFAPFEPKVWIAPTDVATAVSMGSSSHAGTLSGILDNDMAAPLAFCLPSLIWTMGTAVGLVLLLLRCIYTSRRLLAKARPCRSSSVLLWMSQRCRRGRRVRVLESPDISSPCTWGVFRPLIFVPLAFGTGFSKEDCLALRHELVHVERFDVAIKVGFAFVVCVFWFDPFVWLARALALRDMELACDERVLRGEDAHTRRQYALALIHALAPTDRPASLHFTGSRMMERIDSLAHPESLGRLMVALMTCAAFVGVATVGLCEPPGMWLQNGVFAKTAYFSFALPRYWENRVQASLDGNQLVIYPAGAPDVPLMWIEVVDSSKVFDTGNEGRRLFWWATNGDMRVEAYAGNVPSMAVGRAWEQAGALANPRYPGEQLEAIAVDLSTGGAQSAEGLWDSESAGNAWLEFYHKEIAPLIDVG